MKDQVQQIISKKFFLFLVLTFFSQTSIANSDCFWKLLKNPSQTSSPDSVHHFLNVKELPSNHLSLPSLQRARQAVSSLGKKLNCRPSQLAEKGSEHKEICHSFNGMSQQVVCVVEREIGHFIISQDYGDGINIIFNRWD